MKHEAPKLRSLRLVLASKDFNMSWRPKIEVSYEGTNYTTRIPFKWLYLPPKPQFILINVKNIFQGMFKNIFKKYVV